MLWSSTALSAAGVKRLPCWSPPTAAWKCAPRSGCPAAKSMPSSLKNPPGSAKTWNGRAIQLNSLSFTWRLVMAPMEIIDYIVVHELAHIMEKNHSRAYWNQVERMLPDYRTRRKWLKTNGRLLDLSIDADESLIR